MAKLKDLIMEALPIYRITAYLVTDSETNITEVIDEIRATRKITIVNNITSEKFDEKNKARNDGKEEHFITIKFLWFIINILPITTYTFYSTRS